MELWMYASVYVCIYLSFCRSSYQSINTSINLCRQVGRYVCIVVSLCPCAYVRLYTCTDACMYVCMCICICSWLWTFACICICACIRTSICCASTLASLQKTWRGADPLRAPMIRVYLDHPLSRRGAQLLERVRPSAPKVRVVGDVEHSCQNW